MIHALDYLRHALAMMWTYGAWSGNISAGIIVTVAASLIWKPTRKRIDAWMSGHFKTHLSALHQHIEQATGVAHRPQEGTAMTIEPTDQTDTTQPRLAGPIGPFKESHEPRLNALGLISPTAPEQPVAGFSYWDGQHGIGKWSWGPDFNNRLSCCGFAALDHYNVAKTGNPALIDKSFMPKYNTVAAAYFAYGVAQGEAGLHPDEGVTNAAMFAWAYKEGLIDGYLEVPREYISWFARKFSGLVIGCVLTNQAQNDFTWLPPTPWNSPGETVNPALGHDVLLVVTKPDGSGLVVTWGDRQPVAPAFFTDSATDFWVVVDKDDPHVDWAALDAILTEMHGTVRVIPPTTPSTVTPNGGNMSDPTMNPTSTDTVAPTQAPVVDPTTPTVAPAPTVDPTVAPTIAPLAPVPTGLLVEIDAYVRQLIDDGKSAEAKVVDGIHTLLVTAEGDVHDVLTNVLSIFHRNAAPVVSPPVVAPPVDPTSAPTVDPTQAPTA